MKIDYPATKREDVIDDYHGVKVEDPYRWLEDISNPEVQNWIDQQNKLAKSVLSCYSGRDIVSRRTKELLEFETIIGEGRLSLDIRETSDGVRFFYMYKNAGANQPILCYQDGENGKRVEIINPFEINPDGSTSIDWFYPSWDGRYIAYGISDLGTEDSVLHVFDLKTNKNLSDIIPKTRWASLAWNKENTGFYYSRYPLPGTVSEEQMNYYKHVYFHTLGTDYHDDPKVFGDGRAPTEISFVRTYPDHGWILLGGWRYNSADIYITSKSVDSKLIPIIESDSKVSGAYLSKNCVYLVTFVGAKNGRILRYNFEELSDVENIPQGKIVVEESKYPIEIGKVSTDDYLSYAILEDASSGIRIHDLESGSLIDSIEFPSPVTVNYIRTCPKTKKLYLSISSFIEPDSIQIYEVGKGLQPFYIPKVNSDSKKFTVQQIWYESKDATKVPMFVISHKDTVPNKKTPVLIRGYGNGGIPYTPMFHPEYSIWLERGGVLVIPNIRGGGEFGEDWEKMGSRANKQNTYDDFIAATEWLHNNGYGSPETTAMMGRSAGGLLVGAILVQRPELYASVYCAVPLLDMLRYPEFTVAKIWMSYWGNPKVKEEFDWLYPYSPYHNVRKDATYPPVLFYSAMGDIRVDPSHAMKMAASMQEAIESHDTDHPILLKVDRGAGHGVGLSSEKLVEIRTDQVIFHAKHTGLTLK